MTTNAQLAAQLLRGAADFFRSVGEQNPAIQDQMGANAETYDLVAGWVETEPTEESPVITEAEEQS